MHCIPVVDIGLFADQLYKAALIQRKRMGAYVDITSMIKESLYQALNGVFNKPKS